MLENMNTTLLNMTLEHLDDLHEGLMSINEYGFDDCVEPVDTLFMTISTILVLGMIPGLGFFEVGLLPSNITTSVLSQIMALLPILCVMWLLFGFSLSFSASGNGFIGNFDFVLWRGGVSPSSCIPGMSVHIPGQLFALFQMMFAAITPLLMTGAFAGRMRFTAVVLYTIAWEIAVYYVCCYWIWGGGWLSELHVLDFAGGIVIHTSAGVGALVSAWWVGRRSDFEKTHGEAPPSNIAMACVGTAMLWCGWFGFNGGSALHVSPVAVSAIVNTQVAASVAGATWVVLSRLEKGYTSLVPAINGSIAGLAGITPACGYVTVGSALLIGLVLGLTCYAGVYLLKHVMKIDDALDVSVVHGLAGVIGVVAIGFCATAQVNEDVVYEGLIYGGDATLLGRQSLAVGVTAAWSAVMSAIILFVLDRTVGLVHHFEPSLPNTHKPRTSQNAEDVGSGETSVFYRGLGRTMSRMGDLDRLDHRNSTSYRIFSGFRRSLGQKQEAADAAQDAGADTDATQLQSQTDTQQTQTETQSETQPDDGSDV